MQQARRCQRHAARKIFHVNACKVQGSALSGDRLIGGLPVHLHSAHAHAASRGKDFQFFFFLDGSRDQRSSDDGAEAFHGEDAINRQTKERSRVFRGNFGGRLREFAFQIVKPSAFECADGNHGRAFQKRSAQKVFQFHAHDVECFGIDRVGLGDHRDATSNRQQPADIEVLDGLRLDAFIGRDHEQDEIDAADPREHVAHEALVSGDIDEAETQVFAARRFQIEVRKSNVDGDAAALLFFETIGIDAGERFDQRGLAVVDVTGGADDDGLHGSDDN